METCCPWRTRAFGQSIGHGNLQTERVYRAAARMLLPVFLRTNLPERMPTPSLIRLLGNYAIALFGVDVEMIAEFAASCSSKGAALWEMGCEKNDATGTSAAPQGRRGVYYLLYDLH